LLASHQNSFSIIVAGFAAALQKGWKAKPNVHTKLPDYETNTSNLNP
jgi:hypothetical protein